MQDKSVKCVLKCESLSQMLKCESLSQNFQSTSLNVKVLKLKWKFLVQAFLKVKWSKCELNGQNVSWTVKIWVGHHLLVFCPLIHYLEAYFFNCNENNWPDVQISNFAFWGYQLDSRQIDRPIFFYLHQNVSHGHR